MSYVAQQVYSMPDIYRELLRIQDALDESDIESIRLQTHTSEPSKPREGHIYRADGTLWNPGSGEGVYEYTSSGTWNKL